MRPKPKLDRMEGHTFIGNWLKPSSIVLDCGMNQGVFAKRIIDRYGCRVIGIEANPILAKENTEHRNLECYNFAICGQDGKVFFHVDHINTMNSRIVDKFSDDPNVIEVQSITIESFLKKIGINSIDMLKIDIEGAEIELINSTSKSIFSKIPQISSEFHVFMDKKQHKPAVECIDKIKKSGFFCFDFSMNLGNVLFINKSERNILFKDKIYFILIKYFSGFRRFIKNTHE